MAGLLPTRQLQQLVAYNFVRVCNIIWVLMHSNVSLFTVISINNCLPTSCCIRLSSGKNKNILWKKQGLRVFVLTSTQATLKAHTPHIYLHIFASAFLPNVSEYKRHIPNVRTHKWTISYITIPYWCTYIDIIVKVYMYVCMYKHSWLIANALYVQHNRCNHKET